jgi:hypothetical protein
MSAKPVLMNGFQSVFNLTAKKNPLEFKRKYFNLQYDIESDDVNSAWKDVSKEILAAYVVILDKELSELSIAKKAISSHKFNELKTINLSKNFDIDSIFKNIVDDESSLCRRLEINPKWA